MRSVQSVSSLKSEANLAGSPTLPDIEVKPFMTDLSEIAKSAPKQLKSRIGLGTKQVKHLNLADELVSVKTANAKNLIKIEELNDLVERSKKRLESYKEDTDLQLK